MTYDPVGFVFGRLIRQVASTEKLSLIATLPDSALFRLGSEAAFGRMRTQGDFFEFLTQSNAPASFRTPYSEIERRDGWLLAKPAYPSFARAERFNRAAARDMIRAVQARGAAAVEDAVEYVGKTPFTPNITSVDKIMLSHATPTIDRGGVEGILQPPIDFFASMGSGGWRQSMGQTIPFSRLTPRLKNLVEQWVYWSGTLRSRSEVRFMPEDARRPSPLLSEPTEVLPNGIPSDAPIHIEAKEIPAVIARSKSRHLFNLSIYSLAWFETGHGRPDLDGENVQPRVYDSFCPAVQRLYTVTIQLPGNLKESRTLVETVPIPGTSEVKRENLPESFLNGIQEAKELLDRRMRPPGPKVPFLTSR